MLQWYCCVYFLDIFRDFSWVCQHPSVYLHFFKWFSLEIDRYIGRYLGFTDISVSAKTADIIGLNASWQNAVIFHTHPDNLRKKAQRSKSRQLSYNNGIRCGFINKQTRLTVDKRNKSINGRFRHARSHLVQVLCTNQLPLYFRKFSQHEKFDCNLRCRSPSDA